jgi:hypothetical protein
MMMSLLLALLSVTATCTPDPTRAGAGPERVRAYIAAINARDEAAIGRFITPDATFSPPGGAPMPLAEVMTGLLETPGAERLDVIEATAREDGVILRTRSASGSPASAVVRIDGGCIWRFTQQQ